MNAGTRSGSELFERYICQRDPLAEDGSQRVLLDCGHRVICIIPPTYLFYLPCGQCLDAYVEANKQ